MVCNWRIPRSDPFYNFCSENILEKSAGSLQLSMWGNGISLEFSRTIRRRLLIYWFFKSCLNFCRTPRNLLYTRSNTNLSFSLTPGFLLLIILQFKPSDIAPKRRLKNKPGGYFGLCKKLKFTVS